METSDLITRMDQVGKELQNDIGLNNTMNTEIQTCGGQPMEY